MTSLQRKKARKAWLTVKKHTGRFKYSEIKYARNIKKVVLVFVHNIMNIAFNDSCFINLKTEMKYSLQYQHCKISMGQIGYIVLISLLNLGLIV